MVAEDAGVKGFDMHVIGDVQRLARIPFTVNTKSRSLCSIIEQSLRGSLRQLILHLDALASSMPQEKGCAMMGEWTGSFIKPCIAYHATHDPNPDHIIRWAFVKMLQQKGFTVEEICSLIEQLGWDDYEVNRTSYQVAYTFENSYSLPSCSRLKRMGYCIPTCHFRRKERCE